MFSKSLQIWFIFLSLSVTRLSCVGVFGYGEMCYIWRDMQDSWLYLILLCCGYIVSYNLMDQSVFIVGLLHLTLGMLATVSVKFCFVNMSKPYNAANHGHNYWEIRSCVHNKYHFSDWHFVEDRRGRSCAFNFHGNRTVLYTSLMKIYVFANNS